MKRVLFIDFHGGNLPFDIFNAMLSKKYKVSRLIMADYGVFDTITRTTTIPFNKIAFHDFCEQFDYILISASSINEHMVIEMAKALADKITVLGGPIARYDPDAYIHLFTVVSVWEGENISELFDALERGDSKLPPNYASQHHTCTNLHSVPDLDLISLSQSSFDQNHYYINGRIIQSTANFGVSLIETHRGCPYDCGFCSNSGINKTKRKHQIPLIRTKTLASLKKELRSRKAFSKSIELVDDNFLWHDKRYLSEFIAFYNEEINLPILFEVDIRSTELFEKIELISQMKADVQIQVGLQSGSERILKQFKRPPHSDIHSVSRRMHSIFKRQQKQNYQIMWEFITGYFLEKRADILQSINLMLQLNHDNSVFNVNMYTSIPGTTLYESDPKIDKTLGYAFLSPQFSKHPFLYAYQYMIIHLNQYNLRRFLPKRLTYRGFIRLLDSSWFKGIYRRYIAFGQKRTQHKKNKYLTKIIYQFSQN